MDSEAFFWKTQDGRLPTPKAAQTLGITILSVDAQAGSIEVEFDGREEFTNPAGKIQGGFLATLRAGEFAPTLNLNVQFLNAAAPGKLQASGRVVRRGAEVCFLSAELSQSGRLVATATATAIIRGTL